MPSRLGISVFHWVNLIYIRDVKSELCQDHLYDFFEIVLYLKMQHSKEEKRLFRLSRSFQDTGGTSFQLFNRFTYLLRYPVELRSNPLNLAFRASRITRSLGRRWKSIFVCWGIWERFSLRHYALGRFCVLGSNYRWCSSKAGKTEHTARWVWCDPPLKTSSTCKKKVVPLSSNSKLWMD